MFIDLSKAIKSKNTSMCVNPKSTFMRRSVFHAPKVMHHPKVMSVSSQSVISAQIERSSIGGTSVSS